MVKTLIVEDSHIYRQILSDTLRYHFPRMDIAEAKDGEEALKKIMLSPPDIIFMDIKLPGVNGLELTRRVKLQYPATTIIILTSYDLPEYREAANQYQANYFLTKSSVTKEKVLNLVKSILSGKENGGTLPSK